MMCNKKALLSVILAGVMVFALAVPGLPAAQAVQAGKIIYVRANNVADAGILVTPDGTSWATAYPELQNALADAIAAQSVSPGLTVEIRVAAGTYHPTSDYGMTAPEDFDQEQMKHFRLRNNVAIYGAFPADGGDFADRDFLLNQTILSGDIDSEGSYDCLHVFFNNGMDSTAILDGFTITGGIANGAEDTDHFGGGGMCNFNSSPTLSNLKFEQNWGDYGGGMYNQNSSPDMNNVSFAGNHSVKGGGMYNANSSPYLFCVTFDNNFADHTDGGGMYNDNSDAVLNDVVFEDNFASLCGGGMYNIGSSPVLNQVSFVCNDAYMGGGMYNSQSSPSLTTVTFQENYAESGGGMYNDESDPTLHAVDFLGNGAGGFAMPVGFSIPTGVTTLEAGISSLGEGGIGGGMCNEYSNPVLNDVTFEGNSAFLGGGMANVYSYPSVSDVAFTGNDAFMAGGVYNGYLNSVEPSGAGIMGEAPPLVFTDVVFTDNEAGFGGGLVNDMAGPQVNLVRAAFTGNMAYMVGGAIANASELSIDGATFTSNYVEDGSGGAIYNFGVMDVAKTFFHGNYAESGGAIFTGNLGEAEAETILPDAAIVNSVFSCNGAFEGGGIYSAGHLNLLNSTFSGNEAVGAGGLFAAEDAEVTNCIFWGNTAEEGCPQIYAAETEVLISYSLIEGAYPDGWDDYLGTDGGNNIDADPLFQRNPSMGEFEVDFGDLSLRSGSPARDKGNNAAVTGITTDIVGYRRIANGRVDMGAYEYPVAPAPQPVPDPESDLRRLGGEDRFGTAVEVSKAGWETATMVILARADDYADALTGVPLAFLKDAPILLTKTDTLPAITKAEIQRLGAAKVMILGGPAAVSKNVEDELKSMGLTVERVYGSNRFGTAAKIADLIAPDGNSQVALANGWDFPDALSVAPYAAKLGMPILLTTTGAVPAETLTALNNLDADEVFIIGGTAVISAESVAGISGTVRIKDTDRYGTAIELANYFNPAADRIFVATGLKFPDCLTGAVLAAKEDCGILLVGSSIPASVAEYLAGKTIMHFTVLGGTAAVSAAIASQLIN